MNDLVKTILINKEQAELILEENYLVSQYAYYKGLKIQDQDILKFLHKAQLSGADPRLDEIYLIPRNTQDQKTKAWNTVGTIVFSYHFIERKALMSGQYAGMTRTTGPAEYFNPITGKTETQLMCKATVKRGVAEFSFTAWWPEYVQKKHDGTVMKLWATRPIAQLEKCALAGALRSAFPEWLTGVYAQEEMRLSEDEQDQVIETTGILKKEEIQQEVNKQEIKKVEQRDERLEVVEKIKEALGKLGEGKSLKFKGGLMNGLCGVTKFDELKTKTLDELNLIYGKCKTELGIITVDDIAWDDNNKK